MSIYHGRKKEYLQREIGNVPCIKCQAPSVHQWQACANNRWHIAICLDCDIKLNRLALEFMELPNVEQLIKKYEKEQRKIYD